MKFKKCIKPNKLKDGRYNRNHNTVVAGLRKIKIPLMDDVCKVSDLISIRNLLTTGFLEICMIAQTVFIMMPACPQL